MRLVRSILLAVALVAAMTATAQPRSIETTTSSAVADDEVQHAAALAFDAIGEHRLVMLGEMHGTEETPALVSALLDRFAKQHRPIVLALEVATQEQPRFDRYVASRGTTADRAALLGGAHWREAHHDGRDSRAMFELIEHVRTLRSSGAEVELVAFDGGGTDMDARNQRMAQGLRATATRYPASTLLVLTGNVHAMTRRPTWDLYADGKRIAPPMTAGQALKDLAPLSIDVRGATGAFWACMAGRCDVQPVSSTDAPRPAQARLQRNAVDNAWDDTLLLPRFTPSPPAIATAGADAVSASRARSP